MRLQGPSRKCVTPSAAPPRANFRLTLLACTVFCPLLTASPASQDKAPLPQNPVDLVRTAVAQQLNVRDKRPLLTWKERIQKPTRTLTKQLVDTPQGIVGRYIAYDDRPLNAEERQREEFRINRLLDPKQMAEKQRAQKQDEARVIRMIRSLPDAFLYEYAGAQPSPNGHSVVRLNFTPNPAFDPPSRETLIYQGMTGFVIVDVTAMRVLRLDGTLTRDVNIGWGIIGRLDKGGRFVIEQADVLSGHWDQVAMDLKVSGKALIFKSIRVDEHDTQFDFQPVPTMSVAQALNFLQKQAAGGSAPAKGSSSASHQIR